MKRPAKRCLQYPVSRPHRSQGVRHVDAVGVGLTIEDKVRFFEQFDHLWTAERDRRGDRDPHVLGIPRRRSRLQDEEARSLSVSGFFDVGGREANCRAELALNRRLAPDVYLRVTPLTMNLSGALALDGEGDIVEWIVVMRRLPGEKMLDRMLAIGILQAADVDRLTDLFVQFLSARAAPADFAGGLFRKTHIGGGGQSRRADPSPFEVDHGRVPAILGRMDNALESA